MKHAIPLTFLLSILALTGPGCITHHETVYRDTGRVPIEFENETAGRMFYEALSRTPAKRSGQESTTKVNIPLVFEHEERVVNGQNSAFNDAVSRCDTNKDGRITETEARIFLNSTNK